MKQFYGGDLVRTATGREGRISCISVSIGRYHETEYTLDNDKKYDEFGMHIPQFIAEQLTLESHGRHTYWQPTSPEQLRGHCRRCGIAKKDHSGGRDL